MGLLDFVATGWGMVVAHTLTDWEWLLSFLRMVEVLLALAPHAVEVLPVPWRSCRGDAEEEGKMFGRWLKGVPCIL